MKPLPGNWGAVRKRRSTSKLREALPYDPIFCSKGGREAMRQTPRRPELPRLLRLPEYFQT